MLKALRIGRHPLPSSPVLPSSSVGRKTAYRFFAGALPAQPEKMEKKSHKHDEITRDLMSESFGEAYATRSEEEGFGGIYGGNRTLTEEEEDKKAVGAETRPGKDAHMSESFGEAYATRSVEEGFGGIYGGNPTLSEEEEDKQAVGAETQPGYDESQESVKGQEKGGNQAKVKTS